MRTLKLSVPEQSSGENPRLELRIAEIRHRLESLPFADAGQACTRALAQLKEYNRSRLSLTNRYEILQEFTIIYDRMLLDYLSVLFHELQNRHPPQRDLLIELTHEMAFGYKNVLLEQSRKKGLLPAASKIQVTTLYHALKFITLGMQFRAANQEPPAKRSWLEFYQVYQYALKKKLHLKNFKLLKIDGTHETLTLETVFRQTVLHALFDPYRLSRAQSWALHFILGDPDLVCPINRLNAEEINDDSYLINLEEDRRPLPSALVADLLRAEAQLVIRPSEVIRALNQEQLYVEKRLRTTLPVNIVDKVLPIAKFTVREVTHNLLRRRIKRSKRTPCSGSLTLYLGLASAYEALTAQAAISSSEINNTQWQHRDDHSSILGFQCQIMNATQGGLGIRLHTDYPNLFPGLPVYIQVAAGMNHEDVPHDAVSLVRWAMKTGPGVWTLGLQHIAYKVLPIRLRATNSNSLDGYWQSGLYLDNQTGIHSILSPPNMYQAERIYEIEFPNDVQDARATLSYDNTSHFDWFKIIHPEQ